MNKKRWDERQADVNPTRRERWVLVSDLEGNVLDVGEAFSVQQLLGNILWREADPRDLLQPDPRCLRRRLGGERLRFQAKEPCRSGKDQPTQKLPPAPVFSTSSMHGILLPRGLTSARLLHRSATADATPCLSEKSREKPPLSFLL